MEDFSSDGVASLFREGSTSPEGFAGFSPCDIMRKKVPKLLQQLQTMRVSQPRSSKSRASLIWKKGKIGEIKEEPEDTPYTSQLTDSIIEIQIKSENTNINSEEKRIIKPKVTLKSALKRKNTKTKKKKKSQLSTKRVNLELAVNGGSEDDSSLDDEEPQPSTSSESVKVKSKIYQRVDKRRKFPKIHKINGSFRCEQCGRKYKYLRGMRQHQKLECNKEPQFPCPYCPTRFRYRQNIREHVKKHHEKAFPKWYATHYVMPMMVRENIIKTEPEDE